MVKPWDRLDKLTLTEPESLNKLPTLDLEADQKLDVPSRQQRYYSVCYELWYAIQDRTDSYADIANFPCTHPGESLSTIRPWSKIDEEDEFYKIDDIRAPGYPFTWGWYPLSLDEFCFRDRGCQKIPYPHLQMAIFSFDCPVDSNILASELSALVQMIGVRSRQPTFSGTPNIAALLISIFGARQVRVIQAFYSKGGKEGEPELIVKPGKTTDLASESENENEERMDEIIRWMACSLSFSQTEKT
ncbi:unnamed protein product [Penicillium nalgiovense]|nr:unnamed protein product [Penicillium nalgiovense]